MRRCMSCWRVTDIDLRVPVVIETNLRYAKHELRICSDCNHQQGHASAVERLFGLLHRINLQRGDVTHGKSRTP
jgi:hypothetical protein